MLILIFSIPSMLCWALMYNALRTVYNDKSPEFANRVLTFCHGSIMASLGSVQCFIDGWAFHNYNEPTTFAQSALLFVSLGYFMFDLVWCLHYQTETKLMIAHHIYTCFAMSRMLVKGDSTNQATCALGLMEITNPLLQARWFIRTLGYHHTVLYVVVEVLFLLVFISMRLVLGTIITAGVLIGEQDYEFKFLAIVIYLVSWGFMINMYTYIRKKYHDKSDSIDVNNSVTISTQTK